MSYGFFNLISPANNGRRLTPSSVETRSRRPSAESASHANCTAPIIFPRPGKGDADHLYLVCKAQALAADSAGVDGHTVATTTARLSLFFVLLMAQFGVRTVQPVVTLFVQEMVGARPALATLSDIAFSVTGLANVISAPFLGNRSDVIGYRRVLLICLLGATLTTLPQAFTENYWTFTAERF